MKKTFNFSSDGTNYILKDTNPNKHGEPFTIAIENLKFDTAKFYMYVFSDVKSKIEIEVKNLIDDPEEKRARRVYGTINEICQGVIEKLNEKFSE